MVEFNFASRGVNFDAIDRLDLAHRCIVARAAQNVVDACNELSRFEGLGQIIIGAELEPNDAVGNLCVGGKHENRQLAIDRRFRTDLATYLKSVFLGQHHIENQKVRLELFNHLQAFAWGERNMRLHLIAGEILGK